MPTGLHDIDGADARGSAATGETEGPPIPSWLNHDRPPPAPPPPPSPPSKALLVTKYFLHGILFSGLLIVLLVGWAFLTVALVICGAILGLIIALVLYIAMIGWLNTMITMWLWFEVETGFGRYIAHGLVLLIVLLVASLGPRAAEYFVPGIGTAIVMFLVWAPIYGYLAKGVAGIWRRYPTPSDIIPLYGSSEEPPPQGDDGDP